MGKIQDITKFLLFIYFNSENIIPIVENIRIYNEIYNKIKEIKKLKNINKSIEIEDLDIDIGNLINIDLNNFINMLNLYPNMMKILFEDIYQKYPHYLKNGIYKIKSFLCDDIEIIIE